MATDLPPHNVREVAAACVHLLEDPKADVAALCEHVKGPDFPTDAEIITPRSARSERVRKATAGVGSGPNWNTSMPMEVKPATMAGSIM